MTAKIVEVVAKILEGLNDDFSLEEVSHKLKLDTDFDEQTISAAFSLIYDKIISKKQNKQRNVNKSNNNIRLLTESEIELLGLDNYNYLIHLRNVGLLDSIDYELLLEQIALFPNNTITKEDINWIVLVSIVDLDNEILPGSRILLYSSDSIN